MATVVLSRSFWASLFDMNKSYEMKFQVYNMSRHKRCYDVCFQTNLMLHITNNDRVFITLSDGSKLTVNNGMDNLIPNKPKHKKLYFMPDSSLYRVRT